MSEISRSTLFGKLDPLAYRAIEAATVFCKLRGNPYVELQHWLAQILQAQDSDLHRIVAHYGLDPSALAADLQQSLDRLPRGASSVTDLSSFVENAVERGWVYGSLMFGDARVRTGHLLIGLLKTASLRHALLAVSKQFERVKLDDLTENFDALLAASPEASQRASDCRGRARRGQRCDRAGGARQAGGAEALRGRPDRARAQRRARPGRRARRRDPPDRRHPDAPAPEQPDPDRRSRRRQDRGRRRLRAASGPRRRAAAVEGRRAARARHRFAAGRRQHEGRVREPFAPGHRRGPGLGQADRAVHRRSAHADRRRRRGRHRRRGQPAQARAGARHAAHDRRDHLGRIQEVLREGPGTDAALPGHPGARTERGDRGADAAWRRRGAREAPPRATARRGDRGRGAAVAPLHPGAPAARQGRQRARHGLRPRRGEPARDAGRARRHAAPHRRAGDRTRHHRTRRGDRRRGRRAQGARRRRTGGGPRSPRRTQPAPRRREEAGRPHARDPRPAAAGLRAGRCADR